MLRASQQDVSLSRYQRPELVTEGYSADEVGAFASHFNRPVITPRAAAPLPEGVGYAEAINAGKSKHNEDQVSEGFLASHFTWQTQNT